MTSLTSGIHAHGPSRSMTDDRDGDGVEPPGESLAGSLVELGLTVGDVVRWRPVMEGSWRTGRVMGRERDGSVSVIDDRGSWRSARASVISVRSGSRWVPLPSLAAAPARATRRSVRVEERAVRDYLECLNGGRVPVRVLENFVRSAARWAEFRGVTAEALAAVGVPRAVLERAGVPSRLHPSRGGPERRGQRSVRQERAPKL